MERKKIQQYQQQQHSEEKEGTKNDTSEIENKFGNNIDTVAGMVDASDEGKVRKSADKDDDEDEDEGDQTNSRLLEFVPKVPVGGASDDALGSGRAVKGKGEKKILESTYSNVNTGIQIPDPGSDSKKEKENLTDADEKKEKTSSNGSGISRSRFLSAIELSAEGISVLRRLHEQVRYDCITSVIVSCSE